MRNPSQKQGGFTLIEALVAFLVMGFGMLALTYFQTTMSRNADVAKQRTEAMRLAQERMEALRSFTGISTGTINWNGLASGSDTISNYSVNASTVATNTTFTRSWSVGGSSADPLRTASVTVTWTDRAGESQSVTLSSVIARADPSDSGFLSFPLPQNINLKRPKNRNLNIPIRAVDLGGGKSGFKLAANYSVVFSDITGGVIEICTSLSDDGSNYASGANCSTYAGYILSGYVSGDVTNNSSGAATLPTGINTNGLTGWDTSRSIKCIYGQARDVSTNALINGYQYYLCVIPVAADGSYSGTVRLGGVPTNANYKVCRIQYEASRFVDSNERNVQPYSSVAKSLDNQNYYILNSNNGDCEQIDSFSGGVIAGDTVNTVMHQNCRSNTTPTTGASGTCPLTTHNTN